MTAQKPLRVLVRNAMGLFEYTKCDNVWGVSDECVPLTRHYCLCPPGDGHGNAILGGEVVCGLAYCDTCAIAFGDELTSRCPTHMNSHINEPNQETYNDNEENELSGTSLEDLSNVAAKLEHIDEDEKSELVYHRPDNAGELNHCWLVTNESLKIYLAEGLVF